MKTHLIIAITAVLALNACMSTTTIAPDGTKTTVTGSDPVAVAAISNGYQNYLAAQQAERAAIIAEK